MPRSALSAQLCLLPLECSARVPHPLPLPLPQVTCVLCASVLSMMTEYASTYATSADLKDSGLQLTKRSANFSISLSIFCASPGRRKPDRNFLQRRAEAGVHGGWAGREWQAPGRQQEGVALLWCTHTIHTI